MVAIPQCTGQCPQKEATQPKRSPGPRMRNPALDLSCLMRTPQRPHSKMKKLRLRELNDLPKVPPASGSQESTFDPICR